MQNHGLSNVLLKHSLATNNTMTEKYSIAIHPSEDIIEDIKKMKELLANKSGWFRSKNSIAHITICEFEATENELKKIYSELAKISAPINPLTVSAKDFDSFPNGAFFISIEEESKKQLKPIMKRYHNALSVKTYHHSDTPHITIGRALKPQQLNVAQELFKNYDKSFYCENVVLRKFNTEVKQYFVIEKFWFKNEPESQLLLF